MESDIFLRLDFLNAFNTVRRVYTAKCVADPCPELPPSFRLCDKKTTILSFGTSKLENQARLQSGDQLAVIFFMYASITNCARTDPVQNRLSK